MKKCNNYTPPVSIKIEQQQIIPITQPNNEPNTGSTPPVLTGHQNKRGRTPKQHSSANTTNEPQITNQITDRTEIVDQQPLSNQNLITTKLHDHNKGTNQESRNHDVNITSNHNLRRSTRIRKKPDYLTYRKNPQ